ncbi:DUF11 domain-containing protein [Rhodococcus sp. HNM0569]|uniref:COG1361 S-layer family protein n=1 Tax=Rhodococcus sp. HNM0569 TaxID=2716340 RepID=UPI00197DE181|nr:DUF11 domain-containing protein [Rhodococcus sp. HNM0569]
MVLMAAAPMAAAQVPTTTTPSATPSTSEQATTTPSPSSTTRSTETTTQATESTTPSSTTPTDEQSSTSQAAAPLQQGTLDCGMLYSVNNGETVAKQIDPDTGDAVDAFPVQFTGQQYGFVNQLGIAKDGLQAIYTTGQDVERPDFMYQRFINTYDPGSGSTNVGPSFGSMTLTHGAINPANGVYYLGGRPRASSSGQHEFQLTAYDPAAGTFTDLQLTVELPGADKSRDLNGDIAFDARGNMYIVMSSATEGAVYSVPGPIPTGGSSTLVGTQITERTTSFASANSIAFDPGGYLYVGGLRQQLIRIDPRDGSFVSTLPTVVMTDMASCSTPSSIAVFKDLPEGRVNPDDQFTMKIAGEGLVENTDATTEGNEDGLQERQVAPHLVLPGDTVTVTETAAGSTDPNNYTTTWHCVDVANSGSLDETGTGTEAVVEIPDVPITGADVECTFTNTPRAAEPGISLDKSADPPALGAAGSDIEYQFTVTNTGTTPLDDIRVEEDEFSGSGEMSEIVCTPTTLQPGETAECTARYTITQADIDSGNLHNEATAYGRNGDEEVPSEPDEVDVPGTRVPGIDLVKYADPATMNNAGDVVDYSFVVTNNGNVTLTDVQVDDVEWNGENPLGPITCPPEAASLAPNASITCTASYTVTQGDIDRGEIRNVATATGTPPPDIPDVTSPEDDAVVTGEQNPDIAVVKTAHPNTGLRAGDTVTYDFEVTNTGNTTLTDISVGDTDFTGTGQMSPITCPDTTLEPGESVTCTATYTVTTQDAEAGSITNAATATGTPPSGDPVESDDTSTVVTTIPGKDCCDDGCCTNIVIIPIIFPPTVIVPPGTVPPPPIIIPGPPGGPGGPGGNGGDGGDGGDGGNGGGSGNGGGGSGNGGGNGGGSGNGGGNGGGSGNGGGNGGGSGNGGGNGGGSGNGGGNGGGSGNGGGNGGWRRLRRRSELVWRSQERQDRLRPRRRGRRPRHRADRRRSSSGRRRGHRIRPRLAPTSLSPSDPDLRSREVSRWHSAPAAARRRHSWR